jgi:hypothetical protein
MDRNTLQRLVEQARNDPKFFHALVFDTENIMKEIDYLDRGTKAALVRMSPEEAIATIAGARSLVVTAQDYAP